MKVLILTLAAGSIAFAACDANQTSTQGSYEHVTMPASEEHKSENTVHPKSGELPHNSEAVEDTSPTIETGHK